MKRLPGGPIRLVYSNIGRTRGYVSSFGGKTWGESPKQFKLCLKSYAVVNRYQLRFDKCDRSRILVHCGKKSDENKYLFRFWVFWMGNELTWQVKSLEKKHLRKSQFEMERTLAFTLIDGKLVDSYARIRDYGNEVLRSNHEAILKLDSILIWMKILMGFIQRNILCAHTNPRSKTCNYTKEHPMCLDLGFSIVHAIHLRLMNPRSSIYILKLSYKIRST
uniref:Uncharacterized protein n=1 Tax=Lactuca sativa TaxID=4236 RepID=A0A9R1WKM1_LACSA|nr:hypothetical protein LSAT_V11C100044550 [Lactuca sativa]